MIGAREGRFLRCQLGVDLGPTDLSGRPVDHLHRVTGEVDEHPLARRVHLAQRRLQPTNPVAIEIAEPGVAEAVLGILFVQELSGRQREVELAGGAVRVRAARHGHGAG